MKRKPDTAEAVALLRQAAENGQKEAQFNLGQMYLKGRGVKQDDRQAVKWFRKAADQGHPKAPYSLISLQGLDHRDYQDLFEVFTTRDWASELRKSKHSIPDSKIETNDDDPPDVLAEMDGEQIGVEVTRIVDESTEKSRKEHRGEPDRQIMTLWPRERFRAYLIEAVQKKDSQMKKKYGKTGRKRFLHKQVLLFVTKELHLEDFLAEYLTDDNKVTVPRPNSFDEVYVMRQLPVHGPKTDRVEVHYPVFEVSLS